MQHANSIYQSFHFLTLSARK